MPRAFWKGVISFGLVSIPVKMYVGAAAHPLAFHLLHEKCHTRPRQVLHCDKDDEYFSIKQTVRGYEYARDQFVILEEKDFKKMTLKTTHAIEITAFVQADAIDPVYYNGIHFLEPDTPGIKPFHLLRESLVKLEKVAVAKVTFQQREHLCCLRPSENRLLLHTLYYPDEIIKPDEPAPLKVELKLEEREMAVSLINALSREFHPEQYHDEYRVALRALIEAKLRGKDLSPVTEPTPEIPDLMAAMRASILAAAKIKEKDKARVVVSAGSSQ
jgi:DNA end-binding protein Ku